MIIIVRTVLLICLLLWGVISRADYYRVYSDEQINLPIPPGSFYILKDPSLFKVEQYNDRLILSSKLRSVRSSIDIISSDNTAHSYIIEIIPRDLSSKKDRVAKGSIIVRRNFTNYDDYNTYYFNLESNLTDHSKLLLNYNHSDSPNAIDQDLYSGVLTYYDYFLFYGHTSDWFLRPDLFYTEDFLLTETGYRNNNERLSVWHANPRYTNTENDIFGISGDKKINDNFATNLTVSHGDNGTIPFVGYTYTGFLLPEIVQSNQFSSFENKPMISNHTSYFLNSESKSFKLRNIDFQFNLAPEGSYGLNTVNDIKKEQYLTSFNLSNRTLKDEEIAEIWDFPGVFLVRPTYEYRMWDDFRYNTYRLDTYYNTDLFSSGISYSFIDRSDTSNYDQQQQTLNPRLQLYLIGDRKDGYFIKNEYYFSQSSDSYNLEKYSQRSIIGVYRNYYGLSAGLFLGSGKDETATISGSSQIYGGEVSYRRSGFTTGIRYEQDYLLDQDFVKRSILDRGSAYASIQNKNHRLSGRVFLNQIDNFKTDPQRDIYGYLEYAYSFDIGEKNLTETVKDFVRSSSMTFYIDKNLNHKYDPGEEVVSNIKVKLINNQDEKDTNSSGKVTFHHLEEKNYYVNVDETSIPKQYRIVNNEFSFMAGQDLDIPLFEYEKQNLVVYDQALAKTYPDFTLICGLSQLDYFKTINDKGNIEALIPKGNTECNLQPVLKSSQYIDEVKDVKGIRYFYIKDNPKIIHIKLFSSQGKVIDRPIIVQNKQSLTKQGLVDITIKPFKGLLKITVPDANCLQDPKYLKWENLSPDTWVTLKCRIR